MRLCIRPSVMVIVAQKGPVIEARRMNDAPRIEKNARVEALLYLLKSMNELFAEHALMKFRADDAIAVFAGMGAFVFTDNCESFLGNRTHSLQVFVEPEV